VRIFKNVKVEILFLSLALIFGGSLSFIMPVLHNHDEEFHFDECCFLTNAVVKRSAVYADGGNDNAQFKKYTKHGLNSYIHQYFVKKAPFLKKDQVEDKRALTMSKSDILLHIIPAIGVKIGFMIYPSVGVMCLVGRLFSCFFYAITLFFIIRFMDYGKVALAVIALTPTMITGAASLSYDSSNFVFLSLFIALLIHFSTRNKISQKMWIILAIATLLVSFSKENSRLLLLLLPFFIFRNSAQQLLPIISRFKYAISVVSIIIVGNFSFFLIKKEGSFSFVFHKFLNTFIFYSPSQNMPGNKSLPYLLNNIIDGGLWDENSVMPNWWVLLWFIFFLLILFSEKKIFQKKNKIMPLAICSLVVYFLNYFGVILKFVNYLPNETPYIIGPQGRYFTPFLLLFAIFMQGVHYQVSIKDVLVCLSSFLFMVFSLLMYIVIIFFFAYC
jgi:uncharacterized membrane protein